MKRLIESAKYARAARNSSLHSRLHEAKREIEYQQWAIRTLATINDDHEMANAVREFVQIDYMVGGAHRVFRKARLVQP
ncbi:MAG TPA: hypothetical protein VMV98_01195 [Acidobacteriaceae bacterium]|nr:hypothetical protein [Acidobacteriaceae bacterium]